MKHNFKNLKIWQEGMELLSEVYDVCEKFPSDEKFNLSSQMKRAAVSVPSNIAEGSSRISNKDFNRFLQIALGSLFELQTQLIFSHSRNFLDDKTFEIINNKITNLQKMINGFRNTLS